MIELEVAAHLLKSHQKEFVCALLKVKVLKRWFHKEHVTSTFLLHINFLVYTSGKGSKSIKR